MPDRFNYSRYFVTAGRLALDAILERRLSASPRRWLIDLRHLYGLMTSGNRPHSDPTMPLPSVGSTTLASATDHLALRAFLTSDARLRFDDLEKPKVSIVLVVFNRAELTF